MCVLWEIKITKTVVKQMIKVGSDFSGVGAFDQALKRLKVKYKTVFACDMDKYARQTYIENYGQPDYYPENVYDREIPKQSLDIYMTSPPCQAFSLAGKRKGEDDKRGVLFYNSHEFIVKNKPRYFIFENVKGLLSDDGGKTFKRWLDYLGGKSVNGNPVLFPLDDATPYHIYWKVLNAKDYKVPQNRERVFVIGVRDDVDNNFRFPKTYFLDKRLKDVLEKDVDQKYYLSDKATKGFIGSLKKDNIKIKSATKKGYETATEDDSINFSQPNSKTRRGRVGKGVAQTLDTACNQGVLIGVIRGRGKNNNQQLEINEKGTSNSLTTVQKDNVVVEPINANYRHHFKGFKGYTDISPTIKSSEGSGNQILLNKIRRLTPRECFRLMDFPDSFKMPCSDTQMYKQAGNSIVVNVLAEILNKLNINKLL